MRLPLEIVSRTVIFIHQDLEENWGFKNNFDIQDVVRPADTLS